MYIVKLGQNRISMNNERWIIATKHTSIYIFIFNISSMSVVYLGAHTVYIEKCQTEFQMHWPHSKKWNQLIADRAQIYYHLCNIYTHLMVSRWKNVHTWARTILKSHWMGLPHGLTSSPWRLGRNHIAWMTRGTVSTRTTICIYMFIVYILIGCIVNTKYKGTWLTWKKIIFIQ